MPTYSLKAPNGKTYKIEGPEGATPEDVRAEILRRDPSAGTPAPDRVSDLSLSDLVTGERPDRAARKDHYDLPLVGRVPRIPDPLEVAQDVLAWPFKQAFRLAGHADVAAGIKTPEQAEQRAETYGNVARDVAEGAAFPWSKAAGFVGWLKRMAQSGALSGAQRMVETGSPVEGGKAALVGGAFQGVLEPLAGPLRLMAKAHGAKKATAAHETAKTLREQAQAHDEALTAALNSLEQGGHKATVQALRDRYAETLRLGRHAHRTERQAAEAAHAARVAAQETAHRAAVGAHSDLAAAAIANDLKANVPALAEFPASTKGLVDMAYGQGKSKVAEAFDEALQEVIERGRGQVVQLPGEAARRLGFKVPEDPLDELGPEVVATLKARGALPEGVGTGLVPVDAAELAKRVTGFWKKAPGVYRAAVDALDEAGIGDPAARAAFKYYSGIVQYIDKTKALTGEVLDPAALLKGGTSLRTVEELRRRGIGDVFRGPTQAARGAPAPPPEIPKPVLPPFLAPPRPQIPTAPAVRTAPVRPEVPAPDIVKAEIPPWVKWVAGAGPGGSIGTAGGFALGGPVGAALGGSIGGSLGGLAALPIIPSQIVKRAPVSQYIDRTLRALPAGAAILARDALTQRQDVDARTRELLRQADQFRRAQGR